MADDPTHPRDSVPEPYRARSETLQLRRAPKISVFLIAGAGLGILVALILTFAFDGTEAVSRNTGFEYSQGQVFGFIALICIPIGVALAGVVALLFDRASSRRARQVAVEHDAIQIAPDDDRA
ncbi:potassium transporter Trk [Microbacterium sp. NPDC077184]|uniref:potassium transporter Trk n=1 Tax=Microbacterium sp. NPDC077184 TaxID=3154764 RepID=UPI00342B21F7